MPVVRACVQSSACQGGERRIEKDGKRQIDGDRQQSQRDETFRASLLPQSSERDGRRGVERDDGRRQPDVRRMLGIVHDPGQRRGKKQGCGEKQQREQRDGAPCRLEHFLAFPLGGGLSGKAEVARLEPPWSARPARTGSARRGRSPRRTPRSSSGGSGRERAGSSETGARSFRRRRSRVCPASCFSILGSFEGKNRQIIRSADSPGQKSAVRT